MGNGLKQRAFSRCGILMFLILRVLSAQDCDTVTTHLPPITVTALRYPVEFSSTPYPIDVAQVDFYVEKLGARTIDEVLTYGSTIHIQPRSAFGVQSDVSIRGSLFSQQVVLLNGMRANDPQTAHHTMDIPIPIEQIERIEVVKGPLSVLYGADASGGVVNIVTKVPTEDEAILRVRGGQHTLREASALYTTVNEHWKSSIVLSHRQADGYRRGTEFQVTSLSGVTNTETPLGIATVTLGTVMKNFGAENFYGPAPSKEKTQTTSFQTVLVNETMGIRWEPKLSYRRHDDWFQYDRRILDRYINTHTTHLVSAELQGSVAWDEHTSLTFGCEGTIDKIVSSNLGNHTRRSIGIFAVTSIPVGERVKFSGGGRIDGHSAYATQFSPAASVSYDLTQHLRLFGNIGTSFRAPSYTELYYTSPSRRGNAQLQPERGWSYECGLWYTGSPNSVFTVSVFERRQSNLIDYVKFSATDVAYQAVNFTRAQTRGFEAQYQWQRTVHVGVTHWHIAYMYLESSINRGGALTSLYTLIHPRHQVTAVLILALPHGIDVALSGVQRIRDNAPSVTLLNCTVNVTHAPLTFSVQGTNLLNKPYEEIPGVQLPGRWIVASVEARFR